MIICNVNECKNFTMQLLRGSKRHNHVRFPTSSNLEVLLNNMEKFRRIEV
jgi:hypothetical protein